MLEDFILRIFIVVYVMCFFKNQDDLETHLPSCENFKCRECGKTGKRKNERTHSKESCRYSHGWLDIAH